MCARARSRLSERRALLISFNRIYKSSPRYTLAARPVRRLIFLFRAIPRRPSPLLPAAAAPSSPLMRRYDWNSLKFRVGRRKQAAIRATKIRSLLRRLAGGVEGGRSRKASTKRTFRTRNEDPPMGRDRTLCAIHENIVACERVDSSRISPRRAR